MTQIPLYEQKLTHPPYQRHSPTSADAAEQIAESAGTLRAKVLRYITGCAEGATDEEMQISLSMNPSTQRPRRGELQARGLIVDSGRVRRTKSGRNAVVWEAKR